MTVSTFIAITTFILPLLAAGALTTLCVCAYESHKYEQRKKN